MPKGPDLLRGGGEISSPHPHQRWGLWMERMTAGLGALDPERDAPRPRLVSAALRLCGSAALHASPPPREPHCGGLAEAAPRARTSPLLTPRDQLAGSVPAATRETAVV